MKSAKYFLSICFSVFFIFHIAAQEKPQTRADRIEENPETNKKTPATLYQGSYALVIGESEYTNGWDKLPGVLEDIPAVKAVLERRGFKVQTALNLKSEDLQKTIETFIKNYGFVYENRLLIYFAGHGKNLKPIDLRSDLGYIVPVDAPLSAPDEIAFKQKAIPMDDILNYSKKIQAKHALFIFDSCFSGTLVSKSEISLTPFVLNSVEKPVREFITSGSATQTVLDDSIFRKLFVRGLDGEADVDNDGFILGSELGQFLKRELTNLTERDQTPQYGKISDIDLKQGDFVFVLNTKKDFPNNVSRPRSNPISKKLAISGLTKTDICVNPETTLLVTAEGTINLGSSIKTTTPAGKDSFDWYGVKTPIFSSYYMEQNLPLGALLCRFDYEDKWNYCSVSHTLKAKKKGCLIFEVNDKDKTDNDGAYDVTVESQ